MPQAPVLLIPCYQPTHQFPKLVEQLHTGPFRAIVIIDDGSDQIHHRLFKSLDKLATIITHKENKGKGQALKTGMAHIAQHFPGSAVVTADADGQHLPEDIEKAMELVFAESWNQTKEDWELLIRH